MEFFGRVHINHLPYQHGIFYIYDKMKIRILTLALLLLKFSLNYYTHHRIYGFTCEKIPQIHNPIQDYSLNHWDLQSQD